MSFLWTIPAPSDMLRRVPRPGRLIATAALATVVCLRPPTALAHMGLDELEHEVGKEIARRPADPEAHLAAARVHEEKQNWDAALAELGVAADRGADPEVIGALRGRIFLAAGWPRMAKREFDRVLARRPEAYGVLFERGRAWAKLGTLDRAAGDMGRAIAGLTRPTPEQVIEHRDVLLAAGRRADAVRALDDGMVRVGRVASLQLAAVDLEVELRRFDDALRRLGELGSRSPHNPSWIARRGEILEKAGRASEARAEYAKALAVIDGRPAAARRTGALADLRRRLEATLGPTEANSRGERP